MLADLEEVILDLDAIISSQLMKAYHCNSTDVVNIYTNIRLIQLCNHGNIYQ